MSQKTKCILETNLFNFEKILENFVSLNKIKLTKVDDAYFKIPSINDGDYLLKYNYNLNQLKTIAKNYNLKVTGTKPQLLNRIYDYLEGSKISIKIQKCARNYLQKKYNAAHGPAYIKRNLCTNGCDFLSMEEMNEIPCEQFFSYKDDDGLIYGFDLLSLQNLLYKSNGNLKNPFTTKQINIKIIEDFRNLLRLSRVMKVNICTELADISKDITNKKSVELKAVALFQAIDALGNYSNPQWFLELNRINLIKFLRELIDIWNYRAPLTQQTKRDICPPHGDPFKQLPSIQNLLIIENYDEVKRYVLDCLEKMVNTGIDKDSKCLGAYYILGALTLVNHDAATSLPWLYEAVAYI